MLAVLAMTDSDESFICDTSRLPDAKGGTFCETGDPLG